MATSSTNVSTQILVLYYFLFGNVQLLSPKASNLTSHAAFHLGITVHKPSLFNPHGNGTLFPSLSLYSSVIEPSKYNLTMIRIPPNLLQALLFADRVVPNVAVFIDFNNHDVIFHIQEKA